MTVTLYQIDEHTSNAAQFWKADPQVTFTQEMIDASDVTDSQNTKSYETYVTEAMQGAEPSPLDFQIRASDILLFGESTKQSGKYRVRIDGRDAGSYRTKCPDGNMRYVEIIALGLASGQVHYVEIIPELELGEELRIESICVAGGPVQVGLGSAGK